MSEEGGGRQVRIELIRRFSTYESACSGVSDVLLVLFYSGKKSQTPRDYVGGRKCFVSWLNWR